MEAIQMHNIEWRMVRTDFPGDLSEAYNPPESASAF